MPLKIVFPATQFPAPGSGSASNPADTLGTFVRWDCNGFHSLQIHGYVEFDRNAVVPDTPSGEPAAEGTVKAHFRFNVSQRGNWLARLILKTFKYAASKAGDLMWTKPGGIFQTSGTLRL